MGILLFNMKMLKKKKSLGYDRQNSMYVLQDSHFLVIPSNMNLGTA